MLVMIALDTKIEIEVRTVDLLPLFVFVFVVVVMAVNSLMMILLSLLIERLI